MRSEIFSNLRLFLESDIFLRYESAFFFRIFVRSEIFFKSEIFFEIWLEFSKKYWTPKKSKFYFFLSTPAWCYEPQRRSDQPLIVGKILLLNGQLCHELVHFLYIDTNIFFWTGFFEVEIWILKTYLLIVWKLQHNLEFMKNKNLISNI